MDIFNKFEDMVAEKLKKVPSLPSYSQKQIAGNLWWMVSILAVACAVGAIGAISVLFTNLAILNNPFLTYSVSIASVTSQTIQAGVNLIFLVIQCFLLGMAVVPLKEQRRVGWKFLFASLSIGAVAVAVGAISTLSVLGFITSVIFGALWLIIGAYLIFEVRSQFLQVEKSAGVKNSEKKRKS